MRRFLKNRLPDPATIADNPWLRLHLVVALLSYALFTLAALHAVLMSVLERALHRRRMEAEHAFMTTQLEQSERLHRFLVEQSPDLIYTVDSRGHFVFVNPRVETLLGELA